MTDAELDDLLIAEGRRVAPDVAAEHDAAERRVRGVIYGPVSDDGVRKGSKALADWIDTRIVLKLLGGFCDNPNAGH